MIEPDDPQEPSARGQGEASVSPGRSPLSFLLAAIPFLLVVIYRTGVVGALLRLAPLLVLGGAWRLLPLPVRARPWAIWTFLLGGIGGGLVVDIVLELR